MKILSGLNDDRNCVPSHNQSLEIPLGTPYRMGPSTQPFCSRPLSKNWLLAGLRSPLRSDSTNGHTNHQLYRTRVGIWFFQPDNMGRTPQAAHEVDAFGRRRKLMNTDYYTLHLTRDSVRPKAFFYSKSVFYSKKRFFIRKAIFKKN